MAAAVAEEEARDVREQIENLESEQPID